MFKITYPKGAQLRNTTFVYGLVVYSGIDTKLFLNQQPPPSKFSTVERVLNKFILGVFLFQMIICLINAVLSALYETNSFSNATYLGENPFTASVYGLRNFFTYFILFNTMIPISLWVTLELVKVGQAKFMEWDERTTLPLDTVKEGESRSMKTKTSNLNEDLGRIQHIFSDKTGTLTENEMNFHKCSIRGLLFDERENPGSLASTLTHPSTLEEASKSIREFLLTMALCHSVVPE